ADGPPEQDAQAIRGRESAGQKDGRVVLHASSIEARSLEMPTFEYQNEEDVEVWIYFKGGYKIVNVIIRDKDNKLQSHNFRTHSSTECEGKLEVVRASLVRNGYECVKQGNFKQR